MIIYYIHTSICCGQKSSYKQKQKQKQKNFLIFFTNLKKNKETFLMIPLSFILIGTAKLSCTHKSPELI